METTIRTKQYGGEIILPNLTSEAGAKTYGPPCSKRYVQFASDGMLAYDDDVDVDVQSGIGNISYSNKGIEYVQDMFPMQSNPSLFARM
jgi:hypothetical protein